MSGAGSIMRRARARATAERKNARPSVKGQKIAILILGMHRSGTSAFTRILSIAGAELPNHLHRPIDRDTDDHDVGLSRRGPRIGSRFVVSHNDGVSDIGEQSCHALPHRAATADDGDRLGLKIQRNLSLQSCLAIAASPED